MVFAICEIRVHLIKYVVCVVTMVQMDLFLQTFHQTLILSQALPKYYGILYAMV